MSPARAAWARRRAPPRSASRRRRRAGAALGVGAAQAGRRTIVCEVAEQDRVSRAFRREGVVPETEVKLADNLWAITIDPQRALEEWLGNQIGGVGLKVLARSSAFQY